jgi:putative toxin-antitoxin system antitoxin component (TIGR02293 family)
MKTARKPAPVQRKSSTARSVAEKTTAPAKKSPPRKALRAKSSPNKIAKPATGGLEFGEFESLRKQLDLSLEELSARFGLSPNAIAERKASGHLTTDESGKVVCYARLLGHAMYLFGGLNEARQWLKTPQRGLHGAVPLDYAKTDLGAREVENLLTEMQNQRPQEQRSSAFPR